MTLHASFLSVVRSFTPRCFRRLDSFASRRLADPRRVLHLYRDPSHAALSGFVPQVWGQIPEVRQKMIEAIPTCRHQELAWAELEEQLPGLTAVITPHCPTCGGLAGQWRGYRITRKSIIHRRWCKHCNTWFTGRQYARRNTTEEIREKERLLQEKLRYDSWREAYEYAETTR